MKQITFKQLAISVIIVALLMIFVTFRAFCQDTIHVKNVFVNAKSVKVKHGYIIHKANGNWEVNGKEVKLYVYKPTQDPEYKADSSIVKK